MFIKPWVSPGFFVTFWFSVKISRGTNLQGRMIRDMITVRTDY